VLSEYAPALVVLILGLAGWGLLLRRQWYSDLKRALDDLRTEFQHSIETTSSRATRVLAAVKPIELALRDFSGRVANVESRANASDQMSASLQSSLRAQESTSKQLARTVETMNSRLEIFQQDLTVVSGQLSTLRQMIEAMTARNDKHDEKQSTIEVSLGAVQGQMADQLEGVNLGQTEPAKPEETLTGTPIGVIWG
jgi:chromosome segregation ATPase